MTVNVDLERRRGDTFADRFTIKENAVALDITGASFLLTVNTEQEPADAVNQVFQLTGTITDAPGGKVEFAPSALEADQDPNVDFFYDIQMTDSGGAITTIAGGKYSFKQDITK